MQSRREALLATLTLLEATQHAQPARKLRIGQGTPVVSSLPVIAARGRVDPAGFDALLAYAADALSGLDPKSPFWINAFWDEAPR